MYKKHFENDYHCKRGIQSTQLLFQPRIGKCRYLIYKHYELIVFTSQVEQMYFSRKKVSVLRARVLFQLNG
jgi:hypothetical protein